MFGILQAVRAFPAAVEALIEALTVVKLALEAKQDAGQSPSPEVKKVSNRRFRRRNNRHRARPLTAKELINGKQ